MQQTVIVTRPIEYQDRAIAALADNQFTALSAPLLQYEAIDDVVTKTASFDAFVVTSQHAFHYLGASDIDKQKPLFVVGARTAEVAQTCGFENIFQAAGDLKSLADLISEKWPNGARLLHFCGKHRSGELKNYWARRQKYALTLNILYQTICVETLPQKMIELLRQKTPAFILFYSRRTAENFVRIVEEKQLLADIASLTACCLSNQVAEPLKKISFGGVRVAQYPLQEELIKLLRY